jgi:tetratricopeptide (TPR) repeat protein
LIFMIRVGICFLLITIFTWPAFAQTGKQAALEKANAAVKLEREGNNYDEAIKLLQEAHKLDPENIEYVYEIAFAYALKQEYKTVVDILEPLKNHKDAFPRIYQALGNAYNLQGFADKATETFNAGLALFPNAGELYLEKDPAFSSNYYWAAKLLCNSDQEVWGVLYAEIFLNIERNTHRTTEISKLLFDTYKSQIKPGATPSVSFSNDATLDKNDPRNKSKSVLPFGSGVFEPVLKASLASVDSINIQSLSKIRSAFIDNYSARGYDRSYPNVLFNYHKQIKDSGHFEAYNYWLLMMGDDTGFKSWLPDNQAKWDKFIGWFYENPLRIDNSNSFYRGLY